MNNVMRKFTMTEGQISLADYANHTSKLHYHKDVQFVHCYEGVINILIDNVMQKLESGDTCIVLPNQTHSIISVTQNKCFIGVFPCKYIPDLEEHYSDLYAKYPKFRLTNMPYIIRDLMEHSADKYRVTAHLCMMFAIVNEDNIFYTRDEKYRTFILDTLKYLDENFNKSPNLVDLSQVLEYNSHYVSNIFGKCFGQNLSRVINEYRIEHAIQLIKDSKLNMHEIAIECGYDSVRNFNRNFITITGITPTSAKSDCIEV